MATKLLMIVRSIGKEIQKTMLVYSGAVVLFDLDQVRMFIA